MNRIMFYLDRISSTRFAVKNAREYQNTPFSSGFVGINLDFISECEWAKIVSDAEDICRGDYQVFNYPRFILHDWLRDPETGVRIPKSLDSSLIRTSSLIGRVDVKNYWEQGHLHPVFTLGEAYYYTRDDKFANKAVDLIIDFIKVNPCGKTIHWKCPMDVAIRAANICQIAYLIRDSQPYINNHSIICEYLVEHVLYISENYENKGDKPNNHYLSNLAGVIISGIFLEKNYPPSDLIHQRWVDAEARLKVELERQVHPDGSDYENSTYYHCFVTELCCAILSTLKANNFSIAERIQKTCERMIGQCEWLGAFDNRLPLIGDQDGSRVYLVTGYFDVDRCDFSYLSRIGVRSEPPEVNPASNGISKMQKEKLIVYVKCGEIGTDRKGVHDHNDQLSLTVFYNGDPIIIDSGTFLYTKAPNIRKKYRSTSSHSTLVVENIEQNDIDSGLFFIKNGISGESVASGNDSFHGRFIYRTGITHDRIIETGKNEMVVYDHVSSLQTPAHIQYLIPEEVKISLVEENHIQCLTETATIFFDFNTDVVVQEINYSTAYGVEKKGHSIKTCNLKDITITKLSFFQHNT